MGSARASRALRGASPRRKGTRAGKNTACLAMPLPFGGWRGRRPLHAGARALPIEFDFSDTVLKTRERWLLSFWSKSVPLRGVTTLVNTPPGVKKTRCSGFSPPAAPSGGGGGVGGGGGCGSWVRAVVPSNTIITVEISVKD